MAVSKRTRFEVLRRDDYTCRYCRSAENPLTIDHVVPTALGGTDDPSNLVAACKDCNAGKASASPDAVTVAQVADETLRWAAAMRHAAAVALADKAERDRWNTAFVTHWCRWDKHQQFLPTDFDSTIDQWRTMGVPLEIVLEAVEIAWSNLRIHGNFVFRYVYGIMRKRIEKMQADAQAFINAEVA